MNKIKTVSRILRIFFQIMLFVIPLSVIWFWLVFHSNYDLFSKLDIGINVVNGPITVNALTRILAINVSIIPVGILIYCLIQLIKLFRNYEAGKVFTLDNAICYQKLSFSLFAWVIGGFVYDALMSFVLTFQNPPHYKLVVVNISAIDIVALITGTILVLISWIMKEAHKISQEQEMMV